MVLGICEMVHEARTAPPLVRQLVEAVRDHVRTFARAWSPVERAQVARALLGAQAATNDPDVDAALAGAAAAIAVEP
jgi:hypothetical protein